MFCIYIKAHMNEILSIKTEQEFLKILFINNIICDSNVVDVSWRLPPAASVTGHSAVQGLFLAPSLCQHLCKMSKFNCPPFRKINFSCFYAICLRLLVAYQACRHPFEVSILHITQNGAEAKQKTQHKKKSEIVLHSKDR
ncbi:hypothetical protein ILYODFUR_014568 [Ilyodon furcidens]|uniref:Uncharacterized protein n=1 Tax=Ilyodon furcidens TaxID=33524 RepID=A0ABV0U5E7_9TELE